MSVWRLLLREIQFRKLSFLLGLLAVLVAVALPVATLSVCDAADREAKRLMRDMGFNLVIVPKGLDMADFWSQDYARADMPEEYVHRLSESPRLNIDHLVARLQRKIDWGRGPVLLTGLLPEIGMKRLGAKSAMSYDIEPGTVYLGYEAARREGARPGDEIELTGPGGTHAFVVARCLVEQGSEDDIRVYGHLDDVQEVLGLPDRISEIRALSCLCQGSDIGTLRRDLARDLPDTQISEYGSRALTRAETRHMIERYAGFIIPAVVAACGVWVALLALGNVRDRRAEIGILRAMGIGSGRVGALFLGRAVVIGVVGALAGFPLGTWAALHFGPRMFALTAGALAPDTALLVWSLICAPLLCVAAGYIPTMIAVTQDPSVVLREE